MSKTSGYMRGFYEHGKTLTYINGEGFSLYRDKKPLVWGKLYDMGNSISYNRRVDRRVQPFDYNFKLS